jgi:hypothetical protein
MPPMCMQVAGIVSVRNRLPLLFLGDFASHALNETQWMCH